MLQIYVYGEQESGWLDIDPATVLDIEGLSDAFDEDLTTGEFSMPAEAPWTPNNRRLLGFAERLENFSSANKQFRCTVFDDKWPEIPFAQLTILEKSGYFSYTRGKFSLSISGSKGLFGSALKGLKLKDINLGGRITWSTDNSREFATKVMKGDFPQYDYLRFGPVAIENFFDDQRKDFTTEFLAKDTVNTVVVTGAGANDWVFGRPTSANPAIAAVPGNAEYLDYRTIPFFTFKFLIQKIFAAINSNVSGAMLDDAGFDDLVLFNNYAIENYSTTANEDYNNFIEPANHMPDVLVADFLKDVLAFFNVYPTFPSSSEIKLVYREAIFSNKKIFNIKGICSNQFSSNYQESGGTKKGFTIKYNWDSNDGLYSERVKDLKDKTIVATVATVADLATLNIGRTLTTDDIALVESENIYYQVADATGSPILWDAYSERLGDYVQGSGENPIDLNVSTLCTYVEKSGAYFVKRNYVGCKQTGSYRAYSGAFVRSPFGVRLFYCRRLTIGTNNVPVTFNHNRLADNTRVVPFSLALIGTDGIVEKLHRKWQEMKEKGEVVKTTLRVDQQIMSELKAANTLELDNVQFLPYRLNRRIPMQNEMEVELVVL